MMSSKNQFTLTPCPVALSQPGLSGARALSTMFASLRKLSVVPVLAFAVALGFTAQAGAQVTFESTGEIITEAVGVVAGARGSEVTYKVYADILTQESCVTAAGTNQCAFNVLSVVMTWDFGDFALDGCIGDCAADGILVDDSAQAIVPADGGSGMMRYYQVSDDGTFLPTGGAGRKQDQTASGRWFGR